MDNKQLYEKQVNSYNPIFPIVRLEDIIETISDKSIQWILNNYNHIYVEYSESVEITRNKVPSLLRRNGLWITYNNGKETITEYYKGSNNDVLNYTQWTLDDNWERFDKLKYVDGSITYQHLSDAVKQLLGSGNTITNYPDDEDLTVDGINLKLKDREYDKDNFSGLGRIILRKNIMTIDGQPKNILSQTMINKENTIYEIRYDFDLNGNEITIPKGCVLDFQGGSLSNGTIVGNDTNIKANCYVIFDNIIIEGLWRVNNILLDWFDIDETEGADNYNSIRNCFQLSNDNIYNNIYLPKKTLYFSTKAYKDTELGYIANIAQFTVKSNTTVHLDSTIILNPHELTHTEILSSTNTKNISIIGSGKIIGDVETHLGTTGEWCHGIHFCGVKNALIEGVVVEKNWGDGISLDSSAEVNTIEDLKYLCENIIIRNVKSLYNRRQGLSIEGASNIEVCYSEFAYTGKISGTNPMAGIDVEPWRANDTNKNIHIHHCNIHDNTNQNIVVYSANRNTENIIIENIIGTESSYAIKADNVIFRNVDNVRIIELQSVNNINISNIELELIYVLAPSTNGNIYINNCNFNVDYSISSYYGGFIAINSWLASIEKLIVDNCTITKGINAPTAFNLYSNNPKSNIIFKNSYIDFSNSSINLGCNFYNCHIKAVNSISNIYEARTHEYIKNVFEFSKSGHDIEFYEASGTTSESMKDIEVLRFIGNIFTNKESTKTIHFNYWKPWSKSKFTFEGNKIAGNSALGYIPTIIANNSIINNIERNVGDSTNRPTTAIKGFVYFDTTLNKPIWWTGEKWVDATGADV